MAKLNRPLVFQSYKKDTLCYVAVQSVATVELRLEKASICNTAMDAGPLG